MANETHLFTVNVGALNNAKRPILKLPAGLGGITLKGAIVTQGGAGTQTLYVIDMGTGGTASAGTLATLSSGVAVANTAQSFTLGTTPFLAAGRYLAIEEGNVGTTNTVTIVGISYEVGK